MKKSKVLLMFILLFCCVSMSKAQHVSWFEAGFTALRFWKASPNGSEGLLIQPLKHADTLVAWLVTNPMKRFVIISADSVLRPILAYGDSLNSLDSARLAGLEKLLASDYYGRLDAIAKGYLPAERQFWRQDSCQPTRTPFHQWPPDGTTPTGGWLFTNWTQTSPYNTLCPMDLNAGSRSVVGCPATAMAQIFNYNRSIQGTRLDDADDYYHSYGSGNQYWIDDDYVSRQFPSFPQLNAWLDTLEFCYNQGLTVSDSMKAALSFAAGVAARQVYTASVSGTFGINQAHEAILRFGFDRAELLLPPDTSINRKVANDMKDGLPVQLGLVDAAGTTGHNVVVDGYNTNEFYHFNFGWGGSANGWYTLPPTAIPYNLTVIEGVVVQIKSTYAGVVNPQRGARRIMLEVIGSELVASGLLPGESSLFQVVGTNGQIIVSQRFIPWMSTYRLPMPPLPMGVYLFRVLNSSESSSIKQVVR